MSYFNRKESADRFEWPEPLVIDAIAECYDQTQDWMVAARSHASFLRELIEGEPRRSASLRLQLISVCAARGIDPVTIETADKAAFRELTRIVQARFRNSPRLRLQHIRRLRAALDCLPGGHEAVPIPAIRELQLL